MNKSAQSPSSLVPMLIIGALFFMFGFVTWLNGSLIPFLQISCSLNHFEAYFVTMAFYISYTVMALPMSMILQRTGYKSGMVLGLFVMVAGALIFIPAATSRTYGVFLLALFVLGAGLTILQTASNPYIVTIGPRETAAVRISIMGVLNKGAGVIVPLVFTAMVFSGMEQFSEESLATLDAASRDAKLNELSSRLVFPYILMAGVLVVLGLFIKLAPLPEPELEESDLESSHDRYGILSRPHVVLGAVALFFYVGAEVVAGDTIGLFGKEAGVTNFSELTSYTMVCMVLGYVAGMVVIPRWLSQRQALVLSAILGVLFSLAVLVASDRSSSLFDVLLGWSGIPSVPDAVFFVALFGLSNALVWPAVWPLALQGLSKRQTSTASALLIMAIAGGAIIPVIYGALADAGSAQGAYWIMIPCYLMILFYAVKGCGIVSWGRA